MARGDTIVAPLSFFVEDFNDKTEHLTLAEQAIYIQALAYIWKHGSISADPTTFARLTRAMEIRQWRDAVSNVQRMCAECAASVPRVDGSEVHAPARLTQKRVDEDRQIYLDIREKARLKKANQRGMSPGTPSGHPRDGKTPYPSSSSSSIPTLSPEGKEPSVDSRAPKPKRAKPKTQLPADWHPDEPMPSSERETAERLLAEGKWSGNVDDEWFKFTNHALQHGSKYVSWPRAWIGWLGNVKNFVPRGNGNGRATNGWTDPYQVMSSAEAALIGGKAVLDKWDREDAAWEREQADLARTDEAIPDSPRIEGNAGDKFS